MVMFDKKDVVLIGVGVLSIIFGFMLKMIVFDWDIYLYECLDCFGIESLNECNNVGIGYVVLCELNYIV